MTLPSMLRPLAAVTVLTLLPGLAHAQAPQGGAAVQLIRDACIDTGLERAAFESLGRDRGWRRVRMTSSDGAGWNVAYRTRDAQIMLTQIPDPRSESEASVGSICVVTVEHAPASLEGVIAEFAAGLGLEATDLPSAFGGRGLVRSWSSTGEWTLSYAEGPGNAAIISLSRQIVINTSVSVSPVRP